MITYIISQTLTIFDYYSRYTDTHAYRYSAYIIICRKSQTFLKQFRTHYARYIGLLENSAVNIIADAREFVLC